MAKKVSFQRCLSWLGRVQSIDVVCGIARKISRRCIVARASAGLCAVIVAASKAVANTDVMFAKEAEGLRGIQVEGVVVSLGVLVVSEALDEFIAADRRCWDPSKEA